MEDNKNLNLFSRRHLGPNEVDIEYMLKTIGFDSMESFIESVIPDSVLDRERVDIGKERDEESNN